MIYFINNLLLKHSINIETIDDFMKSYFIDRVDAGIYTYMPYYNLIADRLRTRLYQMHDRYACRIQTQSIVPAKYYNSMGREKLFASEIFQITDRQNKSLYLNCTSEEVVTDLFKGRVRGITHFPAIIYQDGTKFRDEIRPKGIIRTRAFEMIDSYAIALDDYSMSQIYSNMYELYREIFHLLDLEIFVYESCDETMLSSSNHEFICTNTCYTDTHTLADGRKVEGLEIGHIFNLGQKYSKIFNYTVKNNQNEDVYPILSSFGIGINRLMMFIIEKIYNDKKLADWLNIFSYSFVPRYHGDRLYHVALKINSELKILLDTQYSMNYLSRLAILKKLQTGVIICELENEYIMIENNSQRTVTIEELKRIFNIEH